MAEFYERIKELRKSMGWSQDTLADKLGTTRSCIGNYEQGIRKPDIESLEQIADLFNVDMLYLIGKQNIPRLSDVNYYVESDTFTPIQEVVDKLVNMAPKDINDFGAILDALETYPNFADMIRQYLYLPDHEQLDVAIFIEELSLKDNIPADLLALKKIMRSLNNDELTMIIGYAQAILDTRTAN